jgi:hypothetical protein
MTTRSKVVGHLLAGLFLTSAASAVDGPILVRQNPIVDDVLLSNQANRGAGLTSTRTSTRDVGDRLFRMRGGVERHRKTVSTPAPAPSAKGGMAKGGMAKAPILTEVPSCWEVFGGVHFYSEEQDPRLGAFIPVLTPEELSDFPGGVPPIPVFVRADTEVDVFGGHVGVERCLAPEWRLGFAVSAASSDVETSLFGLKIADTEIDTVSLIPYVSFHRADALGQADLWADFMYAYTDQSYDMSRFTFGGPVGGSPDGDAHTLDFNIGLSYGSGSFIHGPFAGFRYIDGSIDGYTEFGPGGVVVPSVDYESSVSTLGYSATFPVQVSGGVLAPQVKVAWEHEFEDRAGSLFGLPLAANVEDVFVFGAGVGYYANCGWNAVVNYEGRFGDDVEGHYVGLKVGKEF